MSQCDVHDIIKNKQSELLEMVVKTQSSVIEMGTRITYLEERLQLTHDQMGKLEESQNRLSDKVDTIGEHVTCIRTELPKMLLDLTSANKANMTEAVGNCRKLQDAENQNKFLGVPEAMRGNLLKLIVVGLMTLLGLDTAGIIDVRVNSKDKPEVAQHQQQPTSQSNPQIHISNPITIDKK